MKSSGLFISFEGGEGSGKTTQINKLAEKLTQKQYKVITTREPGGTPEGEKIRDLLVQREGGEWNPAAECLLLYAARSMHIEKTIRPALEKGKIVITDRFFDSTFAYQGYGRGLPLDKIKALNDLVVGDFRPDLTFILDVSPDQGLARSTRRLAAENMHLKQTEDRFESLDLEFHKRLRDGFLAIAKKDPARCVVINAAQDVEVIAAEIEAAVMKKAALMDLFGEEPEEIEDDVEESAPAVVDTGETFGHPRLSKFSIGHEAIEKQLLELYESGRLPHGLVFAGPKGIGKATFAYRLARFLFKNGIKDQNQDSLFGAPAPLTTLEIPPTDPVFSRVASGGHADLLTIERLYDATKDKYKAGVEVDEVRRVAPFLRMTAADSGWRIVVIDDADTMNRNSQNALLKILEEPPKNALLILVTHRAGALIPTIKSRTQTINFHALTPDALKTLLDKQGQRLSAEQFSTLWELSGGSFGRAMHILKSDGIEMTGRVLDLLEHMPRQDWVAVHKFADGFGNSEEGLELFADITKSIFRQLARAKAKGTVISGFGVHKPLMQRFLAEYSLPQILAINDNLQGHFTKVIEGNLDRRQGFLTAFSLIS